MALYGLEGYTTPSLLLVSAQNLNTMRDLDPQRATEKVSFDYHYGLKT